MSTKIVLFSVVAALSALASGAAQAADPIVYYSFDELGAVVTDQSGHGYDGTPNGGLTLSDKGYLGKCFAFNGANAYVQLNRPVQDSFTLTAWIKADVAGRAGAQAYEGSGIFWSDVAGTANDLVVAALGSKLSFFCGNPDTSVNSNGDIVTGEWMHIAAVRDVKAKTISVYIDGKLDNSVTHSNTGALNANPVFTIGGNTLDSRYFNGLIDEVKIYDVALTAAEIKPMAPPKLKARKPNPADGATGVQMGLLQWTKGDTALWHDVYFGTTPDLTAANLVAPHSMVPMFFYLTGLQPGVTYYWRVDEIAADNTVTKGDVWSFTSLPVKAYAPKPADGSKDLFPGQTLSWSPGQMVMKHKVYFSSVQADVAGGAAGAALTKDPIVDTTANTGLLRSSTTYFWRVDEIKIDGSAEVGPVWSFTTADGASQKIARQWWSNLTGTSVNDLRNSANYPNNPTGTELLDTFEGPTDSADNYGTRMYGWLTPPQAGDYTFFIASDDASELWLSTDADPTKATMIASVGGYTAAQAWTTNASQKSAAVTLQAGQKYFIQALHKEGTGGDNLAVAWTGPGIATPTIIRAEYVDTFALASLQAYSPRPLNGAVNASFDGSLSWSAGEKAQKHDVYFGEDKDAVAAADTTSPLYKGQQAGTSLEAGELAWGKTYYWRVDEINAGEAGSPWQGTVWSFTTANYLLVDDMESYNDNDNRIYDTWLDNFGDDSGSLVGNDPAPFAERTIVHGGKQSLPMTYNNAGPQHFFSETVRTFDTTQNWTVNDVNALSLWVRGYPAVTSVAVTETGGKMNLTGSGTDIWNNSDDFTFAYKTLTGDGSIIARVVNIGTGSNTWAKGGIMIRDSLDGGSTFVNMVATGGGGNGFSLQYRLAANGGCGNADAAAAFTVPFWVKIERSGNSITGSFSTDGKIWKIQGTSQTIEMKTPVYIGLCATSHATGEQRTFQFDSIATTGSVSGVWQGAQINAPRYNDAAPLYVVVEDSAAKSATAGNAALVNATAWTQWKIPLKDLTGINLGKVRKLYLGVGDRKSTTAGGTGRIFIDDIRVTKP